MQTLSFYWTPALGEAIRAHSAHLPGYRIECHQNTGEFRSLVAAVNQGIDSHLDAVRFSEFTGEHGRRGFNFETATLHVLVRRLMESGSEEAESLASGICETIGIELI